MNNHNEAAPDSHAVWLRIRGRVQGVGFRAWTHRQAVLAGVAGWVCNRADASVEVFASGKAAAVQHLVKILSSGPPSASVEAVITMDHTHQMIAQAGSVFVIRTDCDG